MKPTLHDKRVRRALLLCLALSPAGTAHALVIGTYSSGTYSYTVENQSGKTILGWSLEFNPAADWNQDDLGLGGEVTVPADWMASGGGSGTIQDFLSLDMSADIPDGSNLAGFSFPSSYPQGTIHYTEFYHDLTSSSGTTVGPVQPSIHSVPDTGSTFWMGSMAGLAALWCRKPTTRRPIVRA